MIHQHKAIAMINKSINEELSVNDNVKRISYEIAEKISEIRLEKGDKTKIHGMLNCYEANKTLSCEGLGVSVYYYFFNTKKEYESFQKTYGVTNGNASSFAIGGKPYINITLCCISGQYNKPQVYDGIFHEVEHVFQQNQSGIQFKDLKSNPLYIKVRSMLLNHRDVFEYELALALYLSFDYESDAYCNGLYAQICEQANGKPIDFKTVNNIVKESEIYRFLLILSKVKCHIQANDENYTKYLKEMSYPEKSLTTNRLFKMLNRAEKRISNKIGKIIVKAKKDCISEMRGTNLKPKYLLF